MNTLFQILTPLAMAMVREALRLEVRRLVGARFQRKDRSSGYARWGKQRGSIYLFGRKVRLTVPRIRNRRENRAVRLETYGWLRKRRYVEEEAVRRILAGLSQQRYQDCAETIPAAIGLSSASVSSGLIKRSARKLQLLMERRLAQSRSAA
jgi:hypothetical protein